MDAVTKAEENEFGMRLEDVIPEVTGTEGLPVELLEDSSKLSVRGQPTKTTERSGFPISSRLFVLETIRSGHLLCARWKLVKAWKAYFLVV